MFEGRQRRRSWSGGRLLVRGCDGLRRTRRCAARILGQIDHPMTGRLVVFGRGVAGWILIRHVAGLPHRFQLNRVIGRMAGGVAGHTPGSVSAVGAAIARCAPFLSVPCPTVARLTVRMPASVCSRFIHVVLRADGTAGRQTSVMPKLVPSQVGSGRTASADGSVQHDRAAASGRSCGARGSAGRVRAGRMPGGWCRGQVRAAAWSSLHNVHYGQHRTGVTIASRRAAVVGECSQHRPSA